MNNNQMMILALRGIEVQKKVHPLWKQVTDMFKNKDEKINELLKKMAERGISLYPVEKFYYLFRSSKGNASLIKTRGKVYPTDIINRYEVKCGEEVYKFKTEKDAVKYVMEMLE